MSAELAKDWTRLAKEFRPLRGTLLLAVAALFLIRRVLGPALLQPLFYWSQADIANTCLVVWVVGSAFIAAHAFASEYQAKTLALLLSQPISRGRLWGEKLFVLVLTLAVFAMITAATLGREALARDTGFSDGLSVFAAGIAAVVLAIGSAAFWSAYARSTVGTLAFMPATLWAVMLASIVISPWERPWPFLALGAAVILGTLAWWRQRGMEMLDSGLRSFVGISLPIGRSGADGRLGALRIVRTGALRNYVAKELRLQRTSVLILLGYAGMVAGVDLLLMVRLVHLSTESLDALFAGSQLAVCLLLAVTCGSSAICEEKSLGTASLNLSLPTRITALVAGKFVVSLGVFCVLMAILQCLFFPSEALGFHSPGLSWNTAIESFLIAVAKDSFLRLMLHSWGFVFGLFVVSFWVSTLAKDSGHAALLAIPVFFAGLSACAIGLQSFEHLATSTRLDELLFSWLVPADYGSRQVGIVDPAAFGPARDIYLGGLGGVLALLLILGGSNFGIAQPRPRRLLIQLIAVVAVTSVVGSAAGFCVYSPARVLYKEASASYAQRSELDGAVRRLIATDPGWQQRLNRTVLWDELVATGLLGAETRARFAGGRLQLEVTNLWPGRTRAATPFGVRAIPPIPITGNKFSRPVLDRWVISGAGP